MVRGQKVYEPPVMYRQLCRQVVYNLVNFLKERGDEDVDVLSEDSLAVGVARLGSDKQTIISGTLKQLVDTEFGEPLHSLCIVGKLHALEADMLRHFAVDKSVIPVFYTLERIYTTLLQHSIIYILGEGFTEMASKDDLRQFIGNGIEHMAVMADRERTPSTSSSSVCGSTSTAPAPPDSLVLSEIGARLEATSKDLEGMLTWLEREIDGISGHTSLMVDQHSLSPAPSLSPSLSLSLSSLSLSPLSLSLSLFLSHPLKLLSKANHVWSD
eukprot:sb/3468175/